MKSKPGNISGRPEIAIIAIVLVLGGVFFVYAEDNAVTGAATASGTKINGVCGASNRAIIPMYSSPDTEHMENICAAGSSSTIRSSSRGWTWTCSGSGRGSKTARCSATKVASPPQSSAKTAGGYTQPSTGCYSFESDICPYVPTFFFIENHARECYQLGGCLKEQTSQTNSRGAPILKTIKLYAYKRYELDCQGVRDTLIESDVEIRERRAPNSFGSGVMPGDG